MPSHDLNTSQLLSDLSSADAQVIIAACAERFLLPGEEIFHEGEDGDCMWIIKSGRMEVYKNIRGDIDRTLLCLGPGDVIGEMGFIDHSRRSAGARTAEACELLELSHDAFRKVLEHHPAIAAAFYKSLAAIVAERLRMTNELYRESVCFSMEATGAGRLNLQALSEELREVKVFFSNGEFISGRILQLDNSPAGYTLVIKNAAGPLAIIPYHAIQRIEQDE